MEIWKDVPGFYKYQVSNFGRVRSLKSEEPLILKTYHQKNGYVQVCFWQNGKTNKFLLHRLVAMLFISNPHGYKEINHKDENKDNNNVTNLEWCSRVYNANYGTCREKISKANKGKKASDETKEKLRIDSSNKRWINNGIKESFAKKEKIDYFISQGWKLGRLERRW